MISEYGFYFPPLNTIFVIRDNEPHLTIFFESDDICQLLIDEYFDFFISNSVYLGKL